MERMKKLTVTAVVAVLFTTGCATQRPFYNALICSVAGGAAGAAIGAGAGHGGREAGIGAGAGAVAGALLCAALTPRAAPDADGDGVPDSADKCPNTPVGVKVDATGCPLDLDSDGDGVPDYKDQCQNTPPGVKVNQLGCPKREPIVLKGVNFVFDSAELTSQSLTILDGVAAILTKHLDLKITIAGHTDSVGTAAYNKKLSQRRAESVRNHLTSRGVNAANLTAVGFGEEQPIASNDEAEGRAKNRRVELQPQE